MTWMYLGAALGRVDGALAAWKTGSMAPWRHGTIRVVNSFNVFYILSGMKKNARHRLSPR